MKTISIALLALLASAVSTAAQQVRVLALPAMPAPGISMGNDLRDDCRIAAHPPKNIEGIEVVKASLCYGFVTAFMLIGRSLEPPVQFCIPKRVMLGQAIDVLLKYLDDNPRDLHQHSELLTISAFRDAWRCRE